ncbi:MAG: LysM peptidoglycan-binding domain-containing protein [Dehalococcoidia bacterium]
MADDEPRSCSFCDQYATHVCARCGKAYCDAHGGDLCQSCRAPASALPSERAFRGSIAVLAIGGVVGLLLLFWTPTLPGEHRLATTSAQNPGAVKPGSRQTGSGRSAVPTPLPTAFVSPTPATARSYTVVGGDTLIGIANSFDTTVPAIQAANPGVTALNLKAGQELLIPPPGATPGPPSRTTPSATPSPTPTTTPGPSPTATATAAATPASTASPVASPAP